MFIVFENLIKFRSPDRPRGEIVSCPGKHRACLHKIFFPGEKEEANET